MDDFIAEDIEDDKELANTARLPWDGKDETVPSHETNVFENEDLQIIEVEVGNEVCSVPAVTENNLENVKTTVMHEAEISTSQEEEREYIQVQQMNISNMKENMLDDVNQQDPEINEKEYMLQCTNKNRGINGEILSNNIVKRKAESKSYNKTKWMEETSIEEIKSYLGEIKRFYFVGIGNYIPKENIFIMHGNKEMLRATSDFSPPVEGSNYYSRQTSIAAPCY